MLFGVSQGMKSGTRGCCAAGRARVLVHTKSLNMLMVHVFFMVRSPSSSYATNGGAALCIVALVVVCIAAVAVGGFGNGEQGGGASFLLFGTVSTEIELIKSMFVLGENYKPLLFGSCYQCSLYYSAIQLVYKRHIANSITSVTRLLRVACSPPPLPL